MAQMTSKTFVADLVRGDKLHGENFGMWRRKISYVLEEQDVMDVLTNVLQQPDANASRREQDAFATWKRKDTIARITMLAAMTDDVICQFEGHVTASAMWTALKEEFDGTSDARLRRITVKLDNYKLGPNTTIRQHLRKMQNMIRELIEAGGTLSEAQQVQAVVSSLPASWDHMKHTITHNNTIKTFADVARHIQLEDDRMYGAKTNGQALLTEEKGASSQKRKPYKGKGPQKKKGNQGAKKDKNAFKKNKKPAKKRDLSKVKCYSCEKKGHFAKDCPEKNKVLCDNPSHFSFVSSTAFIAEANPVWVVDSGATDHVSRDRGNFTEFRRLPARSRWLYVGNNAMVEVKGIGTCKLTLQGGRTLILQDVLYAPEIRRNLVSVISLVKLSFNVNFHDQVVDISNGTDYFGFGCISDGFFVLMNYDFNSSHCYAISSNDNYDTWHARLGHIGQERMTKLANEGLLGEVSKKEMSLCEHCLAGKSTRKPFGKAIRAEHPLKLVHSDICGPMSVRARHGAWYFITFIDDFSRYGHVYLISHKSEALECFRKYLNLVENQLNCKVKALRTDRGREYLSEQFKTLCDEKGIVRQLTIPGTPQQNGVAERRNRTLLDMVRSMMSQAELPISY